MIVRTLSILECTTLLAMHRLAHLACAKNGQPYVVPIYYAYADSHLYAFSMVGKKVEWMRANPRVCIQVNEWGKGREWKSVVVDGRYEELPDRIGHEAVRDHAWSLLSKHFDWWEPGGLKPVIPPISDHLPHVFYRILVDQMSGREAKETK
ncbi:MAG: pyridoxamine 5'-phosphate oxidase family protein [Mesorhizobium sp.]|uniref:pyridoxamine 5'-phosphate oxidase family protein n=1 Tax=unclassified Mesorhizobium TaxID=325217 RepID=UPI000FE87B9A|nr:MULTISPECIES: pyridoxamine 5'-phosphate oxidase family protein [unclassified Mesorhizobium]RWB32414.1 MAG: pyridoxamine 5'-phosphate oxidase family protein [Mesorhizobium sp.]RWB80775.1 MAG: pyridoxamine 5'-phosphate oxidase family protein [Mesorhizobium sp.]RWC11700.1 MAG: pyridoxamine 5'-phosphate oxidase family protein [Mesorhizobium sp.]RWD20268.1 MAG: pyridoxamine 5'-phosphate oxidase family protein [Mesorhizobium sp.]TGT99040.1 pyridoxamine 5'-phosphate oxidase family protein [Mesorhi